MLRMWSDMPSVLLWMAKLNTYRAAGEPSTFLDPFFQHSHEVLFSCIAAVGFHNDEYSSLFSKPKIPGTQYIDQFTVLQLSFDE